MSSKIPKRSRCTRQSVSSRFYEKFIRTLTNAEREETYTGHPSFENPTSKTHGRWAWKSPFAKKCVTTKSLTRGWNRLLSWDSKKSPPLPPCHSYLPRSWLRDRRSCGPHLNPLKTLDAITFFFLFLQLQTDKSLLALLTCEELAS